MVHYDNEYEIHVNMVFLPFAFVPCKHNLGTWYLPLLYKTPAQNRVYQTYSTAYRSRIYLFNNCNKLS